ncbi:hypothetical protein [Streptomyces antioxidans]|nr:hypothetical protein [Streptomyces antioxidans]
MKPFLLTLVIAGFVAVPAISATTYDRTTLIGATEEAEDIMYW